MLKTSLVEPQLIQSLSCCLLQTVTRIDLISFMEIY